MGSRGTSFIVFSSFSRQAEELRLDGTAAWCNSNGGMCESLNEKFSWKEDWKPDIRATLMFVVKEGRILLIHKKRGIGAGKVNGPGGKFEPGETALQCALRETEEELGIQVLDAREMGEVSFSFLCGSVPEIHCHVFTGTDYTGEPRETPEALPEWTSLDAIPYDRMWEDDRYWLPLMLQGHRFKARFLFRGESLIARDIQLDS